jgi:hypothetical protein
MSCNFDPRYKGCEEGDSSGRAEIEWGILGRIPTALRSQLCDGIDPIGKIAFRSLWGCTVVPGSPGECLTKSGRLGLGRYCQLKETVKEARFSGVDPSVIKAYVDRVIEQHCKAAKD